MMSAKLIFLLIIWPLLSVCHILPETPPEQVTIALLDTGIASAAIAPENLLPGWNYLTDSADCEDLVNHGTAVASVIVGCESAGVQGIAPGALLTPLVIADKENSVPPEVLAQAVYDAVDRFGAAFSEKENWLNDTVQRYAERIEQELLLRVRAVEENNPSLSTGAMGKVGERAMASDTTILRQWSSQYAGLAAPPADPGKAGAAQTPTVGGFNDVPENAYFAKAVLWAVEKEITGGTDRGVFSPGQTCTKGQILTFLWRANGSPEPQSAALDGVDPGAFYYKAALWANEQGPLGDGFSFDSPCTRSMAVTYLWKLAGSPAVMANSFDDVAADADYAAAVAWAVEKQITGGTGDRQFSPGQTCTRAEIVTFLWRAFTD